jgi:hypothetical protein
MKPTYVHDAAGFESLVQMGITTEGLYLDFKGQADLRADKEKLELARDIAQFGNSSGGLVLIGVQEKMLPSGIKVADHVVNVENANVLIQQAEQVIGNYLVPSTLSRSMESIVLRDGKTVLAMNVQPSRHLVYVCERVKQQHRIECLVRTSHGKEWMNPDEMERHMMNATRAARLGFEDARSRAAKIRAEANKVATAGQVFPTMIQAEPIEVLGGIWSYVSGSELHKDRPTFDCTLCKEDDDWFEVTGQMDAGFGGTQTRNLVVPYDLLRSAWVEAGGKVAILLSARVVRDSDDNLSLEPL